MTARGPVVVFSRDPGATNHLLALVELLGARAPTASVLPAFVTKTFGGGDFKIFARRYALSVWRRAGISVHDWDTECAGKTAAAVLTDTGATGVITGTSDVDESTDCALWRAAADAGLPSLVIVDHEASASFRFRDRQGEVWPDTILAPDSACKTALLAAGAPADRVIETGNLHIARITRLRATSQPDTVADIRRAWGAAPTDGVFMFASECAMEMAALGRPFAYEEITLVRQLAQRLAAGDPIGAIKPDPANSLLVIRPHPRDTPNKYRDVAASAPLRTTVSEAGSPEDAVLAADMVIGMRSSLLLDARALGVPVHSLTGWRRLQSAVAPTSQ